MVSRLLLVLVLICCALSVIPIRAQTQPGAGGSGSQPGFTLQANSRVVLTDVTVTDREGTPVHGLKLSDFRIFDNNKPQEIASFEEHHKDAGAPLSQVAATAPGVYSNDYFEHPPRVLNIIFLDLTNISIEDQMVMNYQIGKFIDALTPDEPIAIYARPGTASILLQNFTSDHALLRAAVRRVIPRFPPPGREYMNDFQTLRQMEIFLGQIPGRKNVLWLSGGSTFFLLTDASLLGVQSEWRTVYDELEAQRIAIYPIDVRGLTVRSSPEMLAQHSVMSQVAEATGGQALFDNNGIGAGAARIVNDDGEYYTLTYSPHGLNYDNKWHKVRVTMPGTYYTLSYRRGYFADATGPHEEKPSRARTRLLAGGATDVIPPTVAPIIFEASVRPGSPAISAATPAGKPEKPPGKGTRPFTVQYSLPLDAFEIRNVDGKPNAHCGVAVIALTKTERSRLVMRRRSPSGCGMKRPHTPLAGDCPRRSK